VKEGTDGNTLLDICDVEMPPMSKAFGVHPGVLADFDYDLHKGCQNDTLFVSHGGADNVNSWNWHFEGLNHSSTQNATHVYGTPGDKNITLIVSNGYCYDTSSVAISLEPKIKAAFDAPEIVCSKDEAVFTNRSTGPASNWFWDFGEGKTSDLEHPEPINYRPPVAERTYRVSLTVRNDDGCSDSAFANVIAVNNCSIAVPTAFTPNNDGRNDFLYPANAFNAENLIFRVFNRYGQLVFESRDWRRKWDGTINGNAQPSGTYVWSLSYTVRTTKTKFNLKGTTVLIR
jgi:gliding motility-associated-like protein